MNKTTARTLMAAGVAVAALALTACGGQGAEGGEGSGDGASSGQVLIDGSSTVAPNTEVAVELFQGEAPDVQVSVGVSGTGGGFEKFCNGETDISEASRQIDDEEAQRCADAGIEFAELGVANDGLAVVVNPENDWATCLTVDEVSSMWRAEDAVTSWSDVRDGFPDEPIDLYGPGSDSGTFDYFTEEINGEGGSITPNYNDIGEDDSAAVLGVSGATGASGFVPLSFVNEAGDQVRAVEIENEAGECIAPSIDTVMDGTYNPLGRQLFVYPSQEALQRAEVLEFVTFYVENQAEIAETAGFIPLNDDQQQAALDAVHELAG